MKLFARKLRLVRTMRRLSQAELAVMCGFQPSHIAHFESGRREPSLSNFTRLYKALRVGPGILLGHNQEGTYDSLTMEEIDFIKLVTDAVVARHKKEIRALNKRDKRECP